MSRTPGLLGASLAVLLLAGAAAAQDEHGAGQTQAQGQAQVQGQAQGQTAQAQGQTTTTITVPIQTTQANQGAQATQGGQAGVTQQQGAQAGATQQAQLSEQDAQFLQLAILSDLAEIATSQLAVERAGNDEVRAFAERMIQDHTMTSQVLTPLATQLGVQVPAELDPAHQEMAQQLSQLEGEAFDQLYMGAQVIDHQNAVNLYTQQSTAGQHPDLVAFATQTLPALEEHLTHATDLAQQIGAPVAAMEPQQGSQQQGQTQQQTQPRQ